MKIEDFWQLLGREGSLLDADFDEQDMVLMSDIEDDYAVDTWTFMAEIEARRSRSAI